MKRLTVMTSVSLVALALAAGGVGRLYAESQPAPAATVQEQVKGGPSPVQETEMSEHGLAAMNDIQMARLAVNDGYVDNARKLLTEARSLLEKVEQEDVPVTVTTEVKVGDKPVKKETVTERPDLIPILAKIQLVEGYVGTAANRPDKTEPQAGAKTDAKGQTMAKASDDSTSKAESAHAKPTQSERAAAVEQARQQMRDGDRAGAIETLRLVDLGLVSQVVSMPLADTSAHVDKALALMDKDQLHEANLELKQATDALVVETRAVFEPAVATPAGHDAKTESASSG